MGVGKRIITNTVFLLVGQIVTIVFGVIWTAILARYIGPAVYGMYAYAQSILAIIAIIVNLGFEQLLTRDISKRPTAGLFYLKTVVSTKMIIIPFVFVGIILFGFSVHWTSELLSICILVAIITFIETFVSVSRSELYAYQVMHYDTITVIFRAVLVLVCGMLAVRFGKPFTFILGLIIIISAISSALNYYFALKVIFATKNLIKSSFFSFRDALKLFRKGIPFALILLFSILNANVMILILKALTNDVLVGEFAAAQRIYIYFFIIPNMFLQAVLPAFSSVSSDSLDLFKKLFKSAYRYIFILSVPMAFGLWVMAKPITDLIYGAEFIQSSLFLQILGLGLLGGAEYVTGPAILSLEKQNLFALLYSTTLILMIAVGYILIPIIGPVGACWAMTFEKIVALILYSILLFKWLRIAYPVNTVLKTIVASFIMFIVMSKLVLYINFLIVCLILAPIVYFLCHIVMNTFSIDDISDICNVLPQFMQKVMQLWLNVQKKIRIQI